MLLRFCLMAYYPTQGIYTVAAYNAITDTVRAVNKDLFNDASAGPDTRVFFAYTSDYIYWCVRVDVVIYVMTERRSSMEIATECAHSSTPHLLERHTRSGLGQGQVDGMQLRCRVIEAPGDPVESSSQHKLISDAAWRSVHGLLTLTQPACCSQDRRCRSAEGSVGLRHLRNCWRRSCAPHPAGTGLA